VIRLVDAPRHLRLAARRIVFPQIAQSAAQARAMIATGRSDERTTFNDLNIRGSFSINTTALLWVAGTADRSQPGPGYAFSHAPANPLNRYVTVSADHLGTPTADREAVLAWLRELR
jgi:hypothetical protein